MPHSPGLFRLVRILAFAACAAVAHAQQPMYIRIATFNIANLGAADEYERSLVGLVAIVREANPDLLALQEVEPSEKGSAQVQRLVQLLNKAAEYYQTPPYSFSIPTAYTGDERVAFIWRQPVALQASPALLAHNPDPDDDGVRVFQRVPTLAFFRAGNLDFMLLNCHLYTKVKGKSSEGRQAECEAIAAWLQGAADGPERDAIALGDFNRFLGGKSPWQRLVAMSSRGQFRFPLLEAIRNDVPSFDIATDDAPEDFYSTTVGKKRSIYDQVLLSSGVTREFTESPRFGTDVGILAFDNDPRYERFVSDWKSATTILSDHRPVWIRVRVDLPDDD